MTQRIIFVAFLIIASFHSSTAQTPDAMAIAGKVKDKFKSVKDFSAEVCLRKHRHSCLKAFRPRSKVLCRPFSVSALSLDPC